MLRQLVALEPLEPLVARRDPQLEWIQGVVPVPPEQDLALTKALEQSGYGVAVSSDYKRDTVVTVKGEPLALRLRERLLRSAHVMTADEEKRFLKDGYEPYTKYDYRPTGELRLSVIRLDYRHTEKDWSDNKRKKLEHQVGTIIIGLEALVERIH